MPSDGPFDVFLSHNRRDAAAVTRVSDLLRRAGLRPWLDAEALTDGGRFEREIETAVAASGCCAIFVGPHSVGDWQRREIDLALDRAGSDERFRVFPVLLPGLPVRFDPGALRPELRTFTWVDLRPGVGDARVFGRLVNAIRGDAPGPLAPTRPREDLVPYRGLAAFGEEHAPLFFGRESELQQGLEKLRESRFLALVGPSGTGKSSLLHAGLVPALRAGAVPQLDPAAIISIRPGPDPEASLSRALAEAGAPQVPVSSPTALEAAADRIMPGPAERQLVVVVDQLEELFSVCTDAAARERIASSLVYAATSPARRVVVLAALRADYYARCAELPGLGQQIADHNILVGAMGEEALRRAIVEPARLAGLEFEEGLVARLLEEVHGQTDALPLLEHLLLELWSDRDRGLLTWAAHSERGGLAGALAHRADETFGRLDPEGREVARRSLLRLIVPAEGGGDETRRRATVEELHTPGTSPETVDRTLGILADARMVVLGADERGRPCCDIAHEALIRQWPRLRGWLDDERVLHQARHLLSEAARDWRESGEEEGRLYRGARLAWWLEQRTGVLNAEERAFLEASRARMEREQAARRRRVRIAVAGLATALVAITVVAIVALVQRNEATTQRDIAVSRSIAQRAVEQLSTDPERSLLLALAADDSARTDESEAALRQALSQSRLRRRVEGHDGPVNSIAISPDGRRLLSAGDDGTVRVWSMADGSALAVLEDHDGTVWRAAFGPDGRTVASAGADGTIRVRAPDGGDGSVLRGHRADVLSIAFVPDGRHLASAGADGTIRLWALDTGRGRVLGRHSTPAFAVAVSPDGNTVASGGENGAVRLWPLRGGGARRLGRQEGEIRTVAFSPDGGLLLSAATGGLLRTWPLRGGVPHVYRGHRGFIYGAAMGPGGGAVASGGEDGTVRVWRASDVRPAERLRGHDARIFDVAFSRDGRRVASADDRGTILVWEPAILDRSRVLDRHSGKVLDAAVSPEGDVVATAGGEGTIRLGPLRGTGRRVLSAHAAAVNGVSFVADGGSLISAGADGTVWSWDARTGVGRQVAQRPGPALAARADPGGLVIGAFADGAVVRADPATGASSPARPAAAGEGALVAAISSDGGQVAFGDPDGRVGVAALGRSGSGGPDGEERIVGHTREVEALAFSPDGRRLLTGGVDGRLNILPTSGTGPAVVLRGHSEGVYDAEFGDDGRFVVSGGVDRTVRLWSSGGGPALLVLRQHRTPVHSVALSPDGRTIVSGDEAGTVLATACDACGPVDEVVRVARSRLTRELTEDERQAFLEF